MASFRFRLATLLRLREMTRDERRSRLAEAHRAQEILHERQRELEAEVDALIREQRATVRPGPLNVDRLMQAHRHEALLRAQQQEMSRQLELLAQEIETRREALAAAEQDVKTLEKLRDKLAERQVAAEATLDGKLLDELGVARAARREEHAWVG